MERIVRIDGAEQAGGFCWKGRVNGEDHPISVSISEVVMTDAQPDAWVCCCEHWIMGLHSNHAQQQFASSHLEVQVVHLVLGVELGGGNVHADLDLASEASLLDGLWTECIVARDTIREHNPIHTPH